MSVVGSSEYGSEGQVQQSVFLQLRGGVLSGVYLLHHLMVAVQAAAIFIFAFGVGGTLVDPAKAYTHWGWWRVYGFYFLIFMPPFVEYFLYQERKIAGAGNTGRAATYSRASIQGIFFVYEVFLIVLTGWAATLTIYLGVKDFADCGNSAICSGPTMTATPCPGIIMMIVGMGVTTLCGIFFIVAGIFVHAAARDAFRARMAMYFPLASRIGAHIVTYFNMAEDVSAEVEATPLVGAEQTHVL